MNNAKSERGAKLTGVSSYNQDKEELERVHRDTYGSGNRSIVEAISIQVGAMFRLQTKIEELSTATKDVKKAVNQFEKSTNKTEIVMLILAIAQVILAVVTIGVEVWGK